MRVLTVRNVNQALPMGHALLLDAGEAIAPRGIPTIEYPGPVATVYTHPTERVLWCPVRDANPFFHFFEALWVLYGRSDVRFLARLLPRIAEFSDDGLTFNAPYGYRLRRQHGDQVDRAIQLLREDPATRRVVLSIWNPSDLWADSKDIPCNDAIALKVRHGKLHMHVWCRSNDIFWGAYGANVVQFSTLLEYIACALGVEVGTYTQNSDSYHMYPENEVVQRYTAAEGRGLSQDWYVFPHHAPRPCRLFDKPQDKDLFDDDMVSFFDAFDDGTLGLLDDDKLHLPFMRTWYWDAVAGPLWAAFDCYKHKHIDRALAHVDDCEAKDWQLACRQWLLRRNAKLVAAGAGV